MAPNLRLCTPLPPCLRCWNSMQSPISTQTTHVENLIFVRLTTLCGGPDEWSRRLADKNKEMPPSSLLQTYPCFSHIIIACKTSSMFTETIYHGMKFLFALSINWGCDERSRRIAAVAQIHSAKIRASSFHNAASDLPFPQQQLPSLFQLQLHLHPSVTTSTPSPLCHQSPSSQYVPHTSITLYTQSFVFGSTCAHLSWSSTSLATASDHVLELSRAVIAASSTRHILPWISIHRKSAFTAASPCDCELQLTPYFRRMCLWHRWRRSCNSFSTSAEIKQHRRKGTTSAKTKLRQQRNSTSA
jgi:hypothetical protein